jgi:hypothetical protein
MRWRESPLFYAARWNRRLREGAPKDLQSLRLFVRPLARKLPPGVAQVSIQCSGRFRKEIAEDDRNCWHPDLPPHLHGEAVTGHSHIARTSGSKT